MGTFMFRCPAMGVRVQSWIAEEIIAAGDDFVGVECTACNQMHLVNPKTGRVLGDSPGSDLED
jgi:hypothetical protein